MKKIWIVLLFLCVGYGVKAQELGVRFGDHIGGNVAVDAILKVGKFSRIHADLSFGKGVGIDAIWDFLYKPVGKSPLNWYVGVGPSVRIDDPFIFGVSGEIGLAYYIPRTPISLSADYRPRFDIVEDTEFRAGGFGFNVRYVFGRK